MNTAAAPALPASPAAPAAQAPAALPALPAAPPAPSAAPAVRRVALPLRAAVADAELRIRRHVAQSPLVVSPGLGRALGAPVLLKDETVQATRSFKVRGALAALTLPPFSEPVVTASAGNHGLGIAHAAALLGREATVVVPRTASRTKVEALCRYPVTVVEHGETYDEAEAHALELARAGARYVSPYNDPDVVAGQGTLALELLRQVPLPCTVVVGVGGGGLAAGLALWASGVPGLRVVGVEGEGAPALRAALDAGSIVPVATRRTVADGLGGNLERGSITFELARRHLHDLVVVGEQEIREAMRFLALEHHLVAEGAAAVATAALLAGRVDARGGSVVAVVSGGNVDAAVLRDVLG